MSSSSLSEFALIDRYFRSVGTSSADITLAVGDDAAIVSPPENSSLCISIDTLVDGVHFPAGYAPEFIATRALGSALSDLAAMGAKASHFSLALTLPEANPDWLGPFSKALGAMASRYDVALVGGDTTRGPLTVSIQVHGWLPKKAGLLRSGAREGELVLVSGTLGDAGGGLRCQQLMLEQPEKETEFLKSRFSSPSPRLELGMLLQNFASACVDISDGLVADAGHLARSSGFSIELNTTQIPVSKALKTVCPEDYLDLALSAGDDYELLFTVNKDRLEELLDLSPVPLTVVGEVGAAGNQVALNGRQIDKAGYQHFE